MRSFLDLAANVDDKTESATRVRAHSLVFIIAIFTVFTAILFFTGLAANGWGYERLPGPAAVLAYVFALLILRLPGGLPIASGLVLLACYIATVVFTAIHGGIDSYALPLLIASPFAAAFFLGARACLVMTLAVILAVAYFWSIGSPGELSVYDYNMKAFIMALMVAIIALFCFGFSYLHNLQTRRLMQANEKLANVSQAKSVFLANMSHEIRTPLNGVLGMAQSLAVDQLPDKQHAKVETLIDSGKTLMALLNDVLDISKIEAGKMEITPVPAHLPQAIDQITKLFAPRAADKGVKLTLKIADDLPTDFAFDTVRIRQCLANLISNAIKFTERGSIDVSVSADRCEGDSEWLISVSVRDTGIGMDGETAARIFGEFIQADGSTTRQFGGTGLGLAITRKLALAMGGEASVVSQKGQGSTFTFSFRAKQTCAESVPKGRRITDMVDAPDRLRGARVLLVDDQPVNRAVVRLFLDTYKMYIAEASNGREALKYLEEEDFDLVLLDIHMPIMDGPETIKHIRGGNKPWSKIPIIALTADAMYGDRERFLSIGVNGYVSKPIEAPQLMGEIYRSLTSYQLAIGRDYYDPCPSEVDEEPLEVSASASEEQTNEGEQGDGAMVTNENVIALEPYLTAWAENDNGPVPVAPDSLEAIAPETYTSLKSEWFEKTSGELAAFQAQLADKSVGPMERTDLYRLFHDCKAQAAVFGFPLMSDIADDICMSLRKGEGPVTADVADHVLKVVAVLHALMTRDLKGDGGENGAAIRKYLAI